MHIQVSQSQGAHGFEEARSCLPAFLEAPAGKIPPRKVWTFCTFEVRILFCACFRCWDCGSVGWGWGRTIQGMTKACGLEHTQVRQARGQCQHIVVVAGEL